MGCCQNYGPFLDPYFNTAPNIWGTQKGTIILTTTHIKGLYNHIIHVTQLLLSGGSTQGIRRNTTLRYIMVIQ